MRERETEIATDEGAKSGRYTHAHKTQTHTDTHRHTQTHTDTRTHLILAEPEWWLRQASMHAFLFKKEWTGKKSNHGHATQTHPLFFSFCFALVDKVFAVVVCDHACLLELQARRGGVKKGSKEARLGTEKEAAAKESAARTTTTTTARTRPTAATGTTATAKGKTLPTKCILSNKARCSTSHTSTGNKGSS